MVRCCMSCTPGAFISMPVMLESTTVARRVDDERGSRARGRTGTPALGGSHPEAIEEEE